MVHKKDIAHLVAKKAKMPDIKAKKAIQAALDIIIDTVIREGRLELRNFGVFILKERKPRKARNPKTGKEVMVPKRKVIVFKVGCNVKKRLG
ncbi:MAG: HU family DNA-binding protein [Planctomycetes bacterium]|nr:HU family DNA-binding protein [Planctomycetota bacterium]